MSKLNATFMNAVKSSMFNASEWKPEGEPMSLKDIWAETDPGLYDKIKGDKAEVTATTFEDGNMSLRITVPFKDGGSVQLKLSGKSDLDEGDVVSVASIKGQLLTKAGSDPIVRYDAVAIE